MINSTRIIGITGNIATGKSVIRRMLANAGVFGIDADTLANRMLYPGGSAYQQVIAAFGPSIYSDQEQISNKKLGEIVFSDPERLKQLEALVHPHVNAAILRRIKAARRPLACIEAIKLLESGLGEQCDQIWVSHAAYEQQMQRLQSQRGLTATQARARINAQPPQMEKLTRADVIINTETSFKDTWLRTCRALNDTIHTDKVRDLLHINMSQDWSAQPVNAFAGDHLEMAWHDLTGEDPASLYEHLGLGMVLVILKNNRIQAFLIWENWNFTATLTEVHPAELLDTMPALVCHAFEEHALSHQAELLVLTGNVTEALGNHPQQCGYDQQGSRQIAYPAWQTTVKKAAQGDNAEVWLKVISQPFESGNRST
ncbi:MAG: dephospho-CoA kinase [Brevefilum sp.]